MSCCTDLLLAGCRAQKVELCLSYHCMVNKLSSRGGHHWIRLCLPSCRPAFESQANHLLFSQFVFELCHVEKTKINKQRGHDWPIFKKTIVKSIQLSLHITFFKYQLTKICWDQCDQIGRFIGL